jgi:DNA-binding response OmpR family regulator
MIIAFRSSRCFLAIVTLIMMDSVTANQATVLKDKKIFIVEDDRFLHRLLADKFQQWKANVESSFDGEEAIKNIREKKPDVILLDIILPGADGFEILKTIKQEDNLKNIPVIILSNLGQEEDIEKGMQLGAEDFLIKANFTLDEIVTKLTKVFEKKSDS